MALSLFRSERDRDRAFVLEKGTSRQRCNHSVHWVNSLVALKQLSLGFLLFVESRHCDLGIGGYVMIQKKPGIPFRPRTPPLVSKSCSATMLLPLAFSLKLRQSLKENHRRWRERDT